MQERDLFLAVLDCNDPDERAAFLDSACGGDENLRRRVEALLRADPGSEAFLRSPAAALAAAERPDVVGPFRLQEMVGRGGMGVVYRAWDTRLDRHVAVKLLQRQGTAPDVAARFRYEARVTARLQHPGIPPVHDVGELPDGRPYLAMKLVEGRTLHDVLARRPDAAADRGTLVAAFEHVCQAVAFAHSLGVIHRDLKPANVMAGRFGEVQVMDWGLAKEVSGVSVATPSPSDAPRSPDRSGADDETGLFWSTGHPTPMAGESDGTRHGVVLGTPGYMAPEQARGEPADRRSDVFGLGAILCGILTGQPPFVGPTSDDLLRVNAIGDLADAHSRLAGCGADAELVALCARCLSANPADRPEDGGAVAREIATWRARADERARRAEAERAAAVVRASEERKRRRTRTVLGTAVAVVLAAGAGVSAWQAVLARRAEGQTREQLGKTQEAEAAAVRSAGEATAAAGRAARKEKEATEAAADARAFADYLGNNFLAITRPLDVQGGIGVDAKVSDALAKAEADIPAVFAGRPLAEARARHETGVTWRNLGKYDRAEPHLTRAVELRERALGPDHLDTLESVNSLAVNHGQMKRYDLAEPLLRRVLESREKTLGPEHPSTLTMANNLAGVVDEGGDPAAAEAIYRRVLAGREKVLGPNHEETLDTVHGLAVLISKRGDSPAAEALYRRAFQGLEAALGKDHPNTLRAANSLALLYYRQGNPAAVTLLRRVVAGKEKVFGPNHPDTLATTKNLATIFSRQGDTEGAIRLYKRIHAGWLSARGADDPETLTAATNLAALLWRAGRLDQSVPMLEDAHRRLVATLGPDHPKSLHTAANLGTNYMDVGRAPEAVRLYERVYAAGNGATRNKNLAWVIDALAQAYTKVGRPAEAAKVLSAQLAANRPALTPDELAALLVQLGSVLTDTDPAEAERVLREAVAIREKAQPDAWTTFNTMSMLGGALAGRKKYAEAEPLLLKGYEGIKARENTIPPAGAVRISEALDRLIAVSTALKKPDEVKKWRAERSKYPPEVAPKPRLVWALAPPPRPVPAR